MSDQIETVVSEAPPPNPAPKARPKPRPRRKFPSTSLPPTTRRKAKEKARKKIAYKNSGRFSVHQSRWPAVFYPMILNIVILPRIQKILEQGVPNRRILLQKFMQESKCRVSDATFSKWLRDLNLLSLFSAPTMIRIPSAVAAPDQTDSTPAVPDQDVDEVELANSPLPPVMRRGTPIPGGSAPAVRGGADPHAMSVGDLIPDPLEPKVPGGNDATPRAIIDGGIIS